MFSILRSKYVKKLSFDTLPSNNYSSRRHSDNYLNIVQVIRDIIVIAQFVLMAVYKEREGSHYLPLVTFHIYP